MTRRALALTATVGISIAAWFGCGGSETNGSGPTGSDGGGDGATTTPPTGSEAGADTGGSTSPPGTVDVTFGSCAAFTKCGGDIVGSWNVTAGCFDKSSFDALRARKGCEAFQESDVVIKARGTLVVTADRLVRETTIDFSGKATIPKSCVPLPVTDCAFISIGLQSGLVEGIPKFDKATCTNAGANCSCTLASKITQKDDSTYTTTGDGTLTETPDGGTVDYCVKDTKLTLVQGSQGDAGAGFAVTVELGK